MLNPRELRIGNILQGNNGNRVVASLHASYFTDVFDQSTLYQDARGIAIDMDWLEGFGFEKQELEGRRVYSILYDDREAFNLYEANGLYYCVHDGGIARNIDSVHTLQNLYFALTGQELTLG